MTSTTAAVAVDDGRLQGRWWQAAPSNNQPRDVAVMEDDGGIGKGGGQ